MSEIRPVRQLFPSTHWSEVERAAAESTSGDREALARLLNRYLPALRVYLRSIRRVDRDEIEDLLQGFVADRIIAGQILSRADPDRGRFRTFLLKVLNNYVSNVHRDQRTQRRGGDQSVIAIDPAIDGVADPAAAGHAFDVAWGLSVVNRVLAEMEQECQCSGQANIWSVFRARIVAPSFESVDPVPYGELVEKYGFESPTQAGNVLVTGKRMYMRILRRVLSEYCDSEREIDQEIASLRRNISNGSA